MSDPRLAKDCDCVTHDGPHWLHMSRLDREENRRLWADAKRRQDPALAQYVAGAEARRLAELLRALRSAGFERTESLPTEVREATRFLPTAPATEQGAV